MELDDHGRPQAHRRHVSGWSIVGVFHRRHVRAAGAADAADAQPHAVRQGADDRGYLQPRLHPARRHHGVPVHHSVGARRARELRLAPDAGRQGRRVPAPQPGQLLSVVHRRPDGRDRHDFRRGRHRLDVLHAVLNHHQRHRHADDHGRVHSRILIDLHRNQFRRDRAQAARPRHGLVRHAAVCVGHLLHRHHPGAGDAGAGHHAGAADARTRVFRSAFSIRSWAAIRSCSSTSSGSIRTRPCTS